MSASRLSLRSTPTRSPRRSNSVRAAVLSLGLAAGCGGLNWQELDLQAINGDASVSNDSADVVVAQEAAVDGGLPGDDVVDAAMPVDNGTDAGFPVDNGNDSGVIVVDVVDAGFPDTGTPDVGTPDAGTPDTGPADAGMCRITTVAINGNRVLNLASTGPVEVLFNSTGDCATRLHDVGEPSNRTIDAATFMGGGNEYPVTPFVISPPNSAGVMRSSLNMYGVLSGLNSVGGVGVNVSFDLNGNNVRGATRVYFGRPSVSIDPRSIGSVGQYRFSFLTASTGLSCTNYFFTSDTSTDTSVISHGSETPCTTLGTPCDAPGEVCGLGRIAPVPVARNVCVKSEFFFTNPMAGQLMPSSIETTNAIRTAVPNSSASVRLRVICAQTASGNTVVAEQSVSR